jgi:hypothetical protein
MDHALELPHDVDALRTLVLTQRQWLGERDDTIAARDETIAQLEQHNRLLAKLVFGRSSEQRMPAPADPALQGNLFLAEIAAEAQRLAEQYAVVATVEVPAHTRMNG